MQPWIRIGRAFSPWAVALSVPRALPWAGIGARRWRLRAVALSEPRAFHPKEPEALLGGPGLPWAGIGARRWRLRAVALSVPKALPRAGIGARRWRLRAVALSAPKALPR